MPLDLMPSGQVAVPGHAAEAAPPYPKDALARKKTGGLRAAVTGLWQSMRRPAALAGALPESARPEPGAQQFHVESMKAKVDPR
ncbi:MAG: hypothetical protein AAF761_07960 [Pseudomonadota bacterium]